MVHPEVVQLEHNSQKKSSIIFSDEKRGEG